MISSTLESEISIIEQDNQLLPSKPIQIKLGISKKRKYIDNEFSSEILNDDENAVKAPLVIPLIKPIHSDNAEMAKVVVARELTLDERAAAELIQELNSAPMSSDQGDQLVIQMSGPSEGSADTNQPVNRSKAMPLLQANLAPELAGITDDDERFKVDLSLRAEDVNFKSDIYKAVPIEEFGAALLRGMGWTGPSVEDEEHGKKLSEKNVARVFRLGLGALAKPPEQKGGRIDKETKAAIDKEWAKKAAEKLAKQVLAEDDLVWLKDPKFAGRRGKVVSVRGVPGLDKIRIMLEASGHLVEVKRLDAVLLSAAELAEAPYKDTEKQAPSDSNRSKYEPPIVPSSASSSASASSSSKTINISPAMTSDKHRDSKQHQPPSNSSHERSRSIKSWLATGIRVRLVSKKVGTSRSYLQKGWIIDVYGNNLAAVKLDDGSVVDGVKESYLETVLPSTGAICMVLAGKHTGLTATVLEKRKEVETAVVQLTDELNIIFEISMNNIAAFSQSSN